VELREGSDYDILLIPGGFGTRAAVADQSFVERLARRAGGPSYDDRLHRSALLARTGARRPSSDVEQDRLDWVTQQGPRVLWKRKARWVDDGSIVTSSGVSAGSTWRWRSSPACTGGRWR